MPELVATPLPKIRVKLPEFHEPCKVFRQDCYDCCCFRLRHLSSHRRPSGVWCDCKGQRSRGDSTCSTRQFHGALLAAGALMWHSATSIEPALPIRILNGNLSVRQGRTKPRHGIFGVTERTVQFGPRRNHHINLLPIPRLGLPLRALWSHFSPLL